MFDLGNKVAVVTGGAGIIGQSVCRILVECGARVALVDVDAKAANDAAAKITMAEGDVVGITCDVADPKSVENMVGEVVSKFGRIDVLHNNAASKGPDLAKFLAPFESYTIDTWKDVMSVNIDGMFLVAQAVGRQMLLQGEGGSIIQTASIYGVVAPDFSIYEGSSYCGQPITTPAVYAASKAAVIGLSRYLSVYWGPKGIRVNTVVPGGVESGQNDEFLKRYGERAPLGRMARREEIANAVAFLASDTSSYITGQEIAVDGGWTAK